MAIAKTGDTVTIDYVVKKNDGTIVGNTDETGPQEIKLGEGQIMPKIEEALTGMEVGGEKTVALESENAFGPRREEMVIDIPRSNLPPEPAPQPGMSLQAQQQDGTPLTLQIVEVGEETVKADGNHPLAGEDIVFDVTLREIKQAA